MNNDQPIAPATPARGIQWTPGARNLLFLLVIVGLAGGLLLLLVQIGAISGEPVTGNADLSQVLAPFVAIAIAIENLSPRVGRLQSRMRRYLKAWDANPR